MVYNVTFFFNDTATTEIYTLSLHDALPIWWIKTDNNNYLDLIKKQDLLNLNLLKDLFGKFNTDRKSTRLNSSHTDISRMLSSAWKKKINFF